MWFTKPFEKYYRKLPKQVTEKYALDMVNLFNTITSENFKKLAK
jgi:Ca2+-binding EF-hand superfamily protein